MIVLQHYLELLKAVYPLRVKFTQIAPKDNCRSSLYDSGCHATYLNRAVELAQYFGITTTQGLAYLFDTCVNKWSFTANWSTILAAINAAQPATEKERLYVIHRYAKNPTRQVNIIEGYNSDYKGHVYNIATYGLNYNTSF